MINDLVLSDLEQPLNSSEHEPLLIDCNHINNFSALVKLVFVSDFSGLEVEYFEESEILPQEKRFPKSQDFGHLPYCVGLSDQLKGVTLRAIQLID